MAGIFKSLDQSDIRITPFRTYKQWFDSFPSGSLTGSAFALYQADHNPSNIRFSQGSFTDDQEPTTANGKFQRVVHKSIDHLFYRNYYTNNRASFGDGDINTEERVLEDYATIISIPQSKFGEAVSIGSTKINMSWSLAYQNQTSVGLSGSWLVEDDLTGNLQIIATETNPYLTNWNETVGDADTQYKTSVTKDVVAVWPFDDLYKYVDKGVTTLTASFHRGEWLMGGIYSNIQVSMPTKAAGDYATTSNLLGATMHFTQSLSSSLEIIPTVTREYNSYYNFENSDFAISMVIRPTEIPTNPLGSVLITKQGLVEELRVDDNGNLVSQPIPNKVPYKLTLTTGSYVSFERGSKTDNFFQLEASGLTLNTDELYHVALSKSGSQYNLYVTNIDNPSQYTVASGTCTIENKEASNLSNIFVGNSYTFTEGFNGMIDNVKLYKQHLTSNDVKILYRTLGVGNLKVGNIFYKHGMLSLTAIPTRFATVNDVELRGTHTIWETEVSCTVRPGDFGMSSNPSLQEFDPKKGTYVFKPFVTSSYFRPFVTSIGLYDDSGRLLVIGKLSTPIQTPRNVDTTFIIKYDK